MSVIKVGLVDDNPTLLRNISQNLAIFEEIQLVFKATNGRDALSKAGSQEVDIILMDIDMPEMDGIEATRRIKELYPHIKIVMFTVFDREDKIFDAIKAGATGYLMKDERPSRIVAAVEEVMEGGAPMSSVIALKTLQMLRNQVVEKAKIQSVVSPESFDLSIREVEILEKIAEGLTYQQIGDKLFISSKTVRKHIENIYHKLHVHSKLDAVKIGQKNQWF
jgi:DNA-binding NarL/FixJ family response regulator